MLLAGCSTVCTTVAEAAKMWHLVVVSVKKDYLKKRKKRDKNKLLYNLRSLVMLWCIIACIVRSKSVPDAF